MNSIVDMDLIGFLSAASIAGLVISFLMLIAFAVVNIDNNKVNKKILSFVLVILVLSALGFFATSVAIGMGHGRFNIHWTMPTQ